MTSIPGILAMEKQMDTVFGTLIDDALRFRNSAIAAYLKRHPNYDIHGIVVQTECTGNGMKFTIRPADTINAYTQEAIIGKKLAEALEVYQERERRLRIRPLTEQCWDGDERVGVMNDGNMLLIRTDDNGHIYSMRNYPNAISRNAFKGWVSFNELRAALANTAKGGE